MKGRWVGGWLADWQDERMKRRECVRNTNGLSLGDSSPLFCSTTTEGEPFVRFPGLAAVSVCLWVVDGWLCLELGILI